MFTTLEVLIAIQSVIFVFLLLSILVGLWVVGKTRKLASDFRETYGVENEIKKKIEQYVAKVAREELESLVEEYEKNLKVQTGEVVKKLADGSQASLSAMGNFIREEEGVVTKQSEYLIGEIIKKAEAEIEEYKKYQFEGIDEQIAQNVEKISKKVLGKAISLQQHEDLIWGALEEAKRNGIFMEVGVRGAKLGVDKQKTNGETKAKGKKK